MKPRHAFIFAFLISGLIIINIFIFGLINSQAQTVLITRIIDGDTIEIQSNERIRLLNVNSPEKNQPGYEQAISYLKKFENKTVQIKTSEKDKYGRTLARVYTPDYLNLELVEKGYAKKFLVSSDETKIFAKAEAQAIENQQGIWKKSPYFNCFQTQIFPEREIIFLQNNCPQINLNSWYLEDESRKKYILPDIEVNKINIHTFKGNDNQTDIFLNSKQNIWNNDHDTVYFFDEEGNLAHYNAYGY